MRKLDKEKAEAYYRAKKKQLIAYFIVWFLVSYGVVAFAEFFAQFTFNGFPFHYYMGAQGAVLVFIALLFINAVMSDKLDQKYGIQQQGSTVNKEKETTVDQ